MVDDKNRLWQAYLDGELSVIEAAQFEKTLTVEERENLSDEMRFENSLGDALRQGATCPDDVWNRTKSLIAEKQAPRKSRPQWYWVAGTFAAAASLAFLISVFAPIQNSDSSAVVMAARSVEELAATSMVDADRESVQKFMHDHGIHLDLGGMGTLLEEMIPPHHDIVIAGARETHVNGDPVIELFFGCCTYPIKVLIAERDSAAAHEIGLTAGSYGQVRATRVVGDYFTAFVGDHPAYGLLDIFAGQYTELMEARAL